LAERREVLMTGQSFRFLHTSGFRLESTLTGLAEVPDHLRDLLVNAPFQAVEHVTEAAIREDVDFVLLTGDIVDPTCSGPAALAFLQRLCEQLKTRKIAVYWAASRLDLANDFLRQLQLPDNVRIFPSDHVERVTHFRGQSPICTLFGRSWHEKRPLRAAEFVRENQEGFQIAVLYGRGDLDTAPRAGLHYWALGDSATASDLASTKTHVVHSPGRPQGFDPGAVGPHTCSLVGVDGEGEIRVRRIETDAVRWHEERLLVDGSSSLRDARQSFRSHVERLLVGQRQPLLVKWLVTGSGRFDTPLVRAKEREEILDWLRNDYGHRTPALWSLQLNVEPPEAITDDWCDDDSILGDYLRTIRGQMQPDQPPLDLSGYLPQLALPQEVLHDLVGNDPQVSAATLRESAVWGFDLLRGDEAPGRNKAQYSSHADVEGVTT